MNKKAAHNRVDGLTRFLWWGARVTPPCVRELRSSPSKSRFPKSIFSRGHTRRFINLSVFVVPIQALRYTHETLSDLRLLSCQVWGFAVCANLLSWPPARSGSFPSILRMGIDLTGSVSHSMHMDDPDLRPVLWGSSTCVQFDSCNNYRRSVSAGICSLLVLRVVTPAHRRFTS